MSSNSVAENYFQVKVFPNPTTGKCKVSLPNLQGSYSLLILDNFGKVLIEGDNKDSRLVELDLSNFSKGIYLLQIITGEQTYFEKIIKQ